MITLVQLIPSLYFLALVLLLLALCFLIVRQQQPKTQRHQSTCNPYRNLPLDNQSRYEPKSASKPKPEPVPTPVSTLLPAPSQESPSSPVPNSIDREKLEELRKTKTERMVAVNRGAPYKVLLLPHDDRAVADRLFTHISQMNPGQSERWCWDKVLWDLERDRH